MCGSQAIIYRKAQSKTPEGEKKREMKRVIKMLSLLIVFAAALIVTGTQTTAQAQATNVTSVASFPVTYEAVSCGGDTVNFSGKVHLLIHVTTDSNGTRHTVLEVNTQGVKGTGATGAQYVANTTVHETLSDPETVDGKLVYTSTVKYLVAGQGKNPDFLARMTMHITVDDDGNAVPDTPEFTIKCQ